MMRMQTVARTKAGACAAHLGAKAGACAAHLGAKAARACAAGDIEEQRADAHVFEINEAGDCALQ